MSDVGLDRNPPDAERRSSVEAGEIFVRPSTEADAPAMIAIYASYVQHGQGELKIEPMHADDIKRRRKNMLRHRLPHLVAELNGVLIGYAYAVPFRKRPAYRYCVKHSIYVHEDHLRAGVGRKLLPALVEACAEAGFRQMIAYVDSENEPSLNLHEAAAFAASPISRRSASNSAAGPTASCCSGRSAPGRASRRQVSDVLVALFRHSVT